MNKIMFYINALNGGGAERVMTNLSSQFADHNIETVFVTSYPAEGEYPLNSRIKRINLESCNKKGNVIARNIRRISKLRKIIKTEKPDVLVSFMGEPNLRSVIAGIGLKTKVVISVRNDPDVEYHGKVMRFIGKYILPLADGCVFQTDDAKAWFPEKLQKKSIVIFNAVKPDFYELKREPIEGLIVTCGRLQPQKNHKLLINAVKQVAEIYPKVKVNIYGIGTLMEELQRHITELGLEKTVFFKGQTDDVAMVLKKADLFVLTSDYEGMPNALMEALAAGVPCISTDCPCGGPRMLINKNNGILIPVNDLEALVDAIKIILGDEQLKRKFSLESRKKAQKYTSFEIFQQWKIYLERI